MRRVHWNNESRHRKLALCPGHSRSGPAPGLTKLICSQCSVTLQVYYLGAYEP